MEVKKDHRNKGIGTKFMENIFDIFKVKNKYLILEVENPDYGDNTWQRARRIEFYKRHGSKEMKKLRYILPPLFRDTPKEMILMVLPQYKSGKIPGKLVKKIIIQVYKGLYGRNENYPLLNLYIHDIQSTVELI
jgi:hypothetical protein